jgi:glycosyltransferase involved in cell wall biosynthesis
MYKIQKSTPIYLVSLYYRKKIPTGANKRFEQTGKYLDRLNLRLKYIVEENETPNTSHNNQVLYIPKIRIPLLKRIIQFILLVRLLKKQSNGIVISDFMPVLSIIIRNHRVFQLIHDIRSTTQYRRNTAGVFTFFLQKIMLKLSQNIITVSNYSRTQIANKININLNKILVSYNGVDEKEFQSISNSCHLRDIDILYIATFENRKNHIQLLKALNSIDDNTYYTVMIGRDLGTLEECKDYALKNNLNIKFIESCNNDKLLEYYFRSKMYISPSKYEGFGMPVLESYFAGCKVICSDLDVHNEILGNNAIYFSPNNIKELVLIIKNEARGVGYKFSGGGMSKFYWVNIINSLKKSIFESQY